VRTSARRPWLRACVRGRALPAFRGVEEHPSLRFAGVAAVAAPMDRAPGLGRGGWIDFGRLT
jgi:hypothetical protein